MVWTGFGHHDTAVLYEDCMDALGKERWCAAEHMSYKVGARGH